MVEKVGHDHEKGGLADLVAVVNDCGGQVGLAAAGLPHKDQPALGVFSEIEGQAVGGVHVVLLLGG